MATFPPLQGEDHLSAVLYLLAEGGVDKFLDGKKSDLNFLFISNGT
jgi:hypothetical protein